MMSMLVADLDVRRKQQLQRQRGQIDRQFLCGAVGEEVGTAVRGVTSIPLGKAGSQGSALGLRATSGQDQMAQDLCISPMQLPKFWEQYKNAALKYVPQQNPVLADPQHQHLPQPQTRRQPQTSEPVRVEPWWLS